MESNNSKDVKVLLTVYEDFKKHTVVEYDEDAHLLLEELEQQLHKEDGEEWNG